LINANKLRKKLLPWLAATQLSFEKAANCINQNRCLWHKWHNCSLGFIES